MTHTMRRPDDFHAHLRQGPMLRRVVRHTARSFGRVLAMPNTVPPITTAARIAEYREEVTRALEPGLRLDLLPTFKLIPGLRASEVPLLAVAGAVGGKLYPAGVTTNSADGPSDVAELYPILAAMEDAGLVLEIHAELPGVFSLDREAAFLPTVRGLAARFPALRIVIEHLSTAAAVELLAELPPTVAATVTAHHLLLTLDDVIGGELRPHRFCKPIPKRPADREALRRAVFGGDPRVFFGSDSAPHGRADKERDCGCAGVYTAPVVVELLAGLFAAHGLPLTEAAAGPLAGGPTAPESGAAPTRYRPNLESFLSRYGAEFYRLPLAAQTVELEESEWIVPEEYDGIVPLCAGERLSYRIRA